MIVIYYVSGFIFPIWGEASTELSRSAKLTDLSAGLPVLKAGTQHAG